MQIRGVCLRGSGQKKAARTFCCSCREASDANYFQFWCDPEGPLSIAGIYTPYYRFTLKQIQKFRFSRHTGHETSYGERTSKGSSYRGLTKGVVGRGGSENDKRHKIIEFRRNPSEFGLGQTESGTQWLG